MKTKIILLTFLIFAGVLVWAGDVKAQTSVGSQCSSGTCGQSQSGCTHSSDATIVQSQCASCSDMSDYLARMAADCQSTGQSSLVGGDCNNISANGYYGACAAAYAPQYGGSGGTSPSTSPSTGPSTSLTCPTGFEKEAGVCFPTGTGLSETSISDILKNALFWLLGIFGFIGIAGFVISGIQYLTSAGNEKGIETAKRNMKWSLIGVVVGISGMVIIKAITAALQATTSSF